ncbi:hypothetical protein F5Y10DRAFT_234653 [Nemania abortiva]|nr:hypothetical protein F5Y10DRAFT_234653 [Nemania abortiva]
MERLVRQNESEEPANTATMDSPMTDGPDGNNTIYFCDVCYKPIARETAYKRHLAYCRRSIGRTKKRKRSCKQCHQAKAKCSFEPQCSRCISKGFICEYEKLGFPSAGSEMSDDLQDSLISEPSGSSPSDATGSPINTFTEIAGFERAADISKLLPLGVPPRLVTELRTDPRQQSSALFLLEVLRGVPYMVTRRETFPVFIHGQWHQPKLPTTLTNCMRISQLFLERNASLKGRDAFHSALSKERARIDQQPSMGIRQELLVRLTVCNVYTLLSVFDREMPQATLVPQLEAQRLDVDCITNAARECFAFDAYQPFDIDKIGNPSETWEEFIYAESRRRCALFWFIISRVVDLQHGLRCPPVVCYRGLALPGPEALWRARTREEWEMARATLRERCRDPYHQNSLRTLGDLIDCRACKSDPGRGRQVSSWVATCDKMGLMILVASTMV